MKLTFQLHKNIDGSQTLWYPYGGELVKVVRYGEDEPPTSERINRDTAIFLRGINLGRS